MDDEEAPLRNISNQSELECGFGDEELKEMDESMKAHAELIKSMSKYEKKLMKGLMRGFANTMILWLISRKRQHGYEIMTKLHESTPYEKKMPSASKIYPVLHDLERHEMVKGTWEHHGKRKVKYYEITKEGEETLCRFRAMAQFAKKNKSSLFLEFMKDMLVHDDNEDNRS